MARWDLSKLDDERAQMQERIEELEAKGLANRVAIMRLEAKLAKAMGALGDIHDGEPEWPNDPQKELDWCRNRARRTLAEVKGEK